jgi:hypothetical protein
VDGGTTFENVFSSPEGGHNSALLYGQLTTEPVPEPASLLLLRRRADGGRDAHAPRTRGVSSPRVAGSGTPGIAPLGVPVRCLQSPGMPDPSALTQLLWLFILSGVVACIAWTVTHEKCSRNRASWCVRQSENRQRSWWARKWYYLFTCEYCFSHYVSAAIVAVTAFISSCPAGAASASRGFVRLDRQPLHEPVRQAPARHQA